MLPFNWHNLVIFHPILIFLFKLLVYSILVFDPIFAPKPRIFHKQHCANGPKTTLKMSGHVLAFPFNSYIKNRIFQNYRPDPPPPPPKCQKFSFKILSSNLHDMSKRIIILLFYYFIILLFYYFIILLFYYFIILLFYYFIILLFYYFIILLFYYFIILLFYYFNILSF